jgi:hypothetical protein
VARRQTRRCLRVLRRRYQGGGPHPFCSSGGNLGNGRTRTAMYTDSIEQAPRHGGRTAGQGSGRERASGIYHSKQWRLDHVRQIPELTACDTGDDRLAAIALGPWPKMAGERGLSS